jgi:hypothetical protein
MNRRCDHHGSFLSEAFLGGWLPSNQHQAAIVAVRSSGVERAGSASRGPPRGPFSQRTSTPGGTVRTGAEI